MGVLGGRVDRDPVVPALVDELDRERADGVRTETATLRVGTQEEVDAGVAEIRLEAAMLSSEPTPARQRQVGVMDRNRSPWE